MNDTLDTLALRDAVLATLRRIAPELEVGGLESTKPLRDQVDLDSMDWLNFLVALNKKLGVEIPERDYGKLVSLDDLLAYLHTTLQPQAIPDVQS